MKNQVSRFIELIGQEHLRLCMEKNHYSSNELSVALGNCTILALAHLNDELSEELKYKRLCNCHMHAIGAACKCYCHGGTRDQAAK